MGTLNTLDSFILFTVLVLGTVLLGEMAVYVLDLNGLLYKNLSEQLTLKQIEETMDLKTRWAWVGYVLLPLLLFLKITVIAWILGIGGFFTNTALPHKVYFQIVLKAEFVFLLAVVFKILWFKFAIPKFTLEEVQQFVPLSLQNMVDTVQLPSWALYPLQLISLFEAAYWILLAYFIDKAANTNKGIKVVLTAYAPGLLIWMVFIMFLTLNLTP